MCIGSRTARRYVCVVLFGLMGSGSVVLGQYTQVRRLSETLEANQEALQDYTWKRRITISVNGEQQLVQLFDVRHDPDGNIEKTPIAGPEEETAVKGPVRKKKAKKKQQQAAELTEGLKKFIDGYIHMTPERMHRYVMQSKVYHGRGKSGTETQIQSRNVVFQGDSMDITIDGPSGVPKRLEIMTSHEGEPVHLVTEFARLDDGTGYPGRSVVKTEVKEKQLTIIVENFDYEKLDG
jgi:hypothetical protein